MPGERPPPSARSTAPIEVTSEPNAIPLRVLVVDDEENIRETLGLCLRNLGCDVALVASGAAALATCQQHRLDLAFLDIRLEDESGFDVLPRLLEEQPDLDVIVISAYASIDSAVEAMRRGAKDYLPKPFTPAQIRVLVDRTRIRRRAEPHVTRLEAELDASAPEAHLETASPPMRSALDLVRRAAARDIPVLLSGENGTGKGVLARAVHAQSTRREGPFVVVSCANATEGALGVELFGRPDALVSQGRLEDAAGGTLFLDEVGELSLALQGSLIRLLETKRFSRFGGSELHASDARIVVATHRDLEAEVKAGRFRHELLYRLNVLEIRVPPLRERPEDILPLARAFASSFAARSGTAPPSLSRDAEKLLLGWPWPGNIRELRNSMERAVLLATGPLLERDLFPERMWLQPTGRVTPGGDFTAEEMEREHILRVLSRTATLQEACRILDIDVTTLWRKRKRWKI